jgi:hypothetical protein
VLRHYRLTPTAFAALPDGDQSFMLGFELYRARQLAELREAMSDEDPKKSKLSPEVFTMIALERL